ncbi:MAG: inorganic diphosphatase [Pyrinomonadaceae bacterium]
MNPWHDISYGAKAPEIVSSVIEISKGSKGKFELDKESGLIRLDRVLYSSVHYPANYGFIPQTYCDDKDPLDILVFASIKIPKMCLIDAKVIGVMRMVDSGETDDKIIAVAANDISVSYRNDISELPPHTTLEMQTFFQDYKALEHKEVVVEEFYGREKAFEIVNDSIELYRKTFGKKQ